MLSFNYSIQQKYNKFLNKKKYTTYYCNYCKQLFVDNQKECWNIFMYLNQAD
jgi:hypothetical protein